jgi:Holin of 3TMs, for gene-transfer release
MGIFEFLGSIVKPITDLIDNLTTSDEEKLSLKNELVKLQNDVAVKVIDYQSKLLDSQTRLIEAEAKGQSWLQRNWRPITMITFLFLVVMDSFGLLSFRLSGEAPAMRGKPSNAG